MMRFWIYDEESKLFRKFAFKVEAQNFLQPGWRLVVQPKPAIKYPTPEEFGEAPF